MEESGVESGGAPDGEVSTPAEVPVVRQRRRDERQAQALSDEVDDELRPVGRPKKVEPYGGRVTGLKMELAAKTTGLLPVSAKESPKLKMDL